MMDNYSQEMGNKRSESFICPSLVPWDSFQTVTQREGSRRTLADSLSWTHQVQSPETRDWERERTEEEKDTQIKNCGDLQRVFSWVLINTSMSDNYPTPGKGPPERFKGNSAQHLPKASNCACAQVRTYDFMIPRVLGEVYSRILPQ